MSQSPTRRSLSNAIKRFTKPSPKIEPKTFYTQHHQWVRINNPNEAELTANMGGPITAKLGLTEYGQDSLGNLQKIYLDSVSLNEDLTRGTDFLTIKHTHRKSENYKIRDIELPINCKIVELNRSLEDLPQIVNRSPEDDGWICSISADKADIENLMTKQEYEAFLKKSFRR